MVARKPIPVTWKTARSFLDFPGEIRNLIYDFVCEEHVALASRRYSQHHPLLPPNQPRAYPFGLALSCRQIRTELLPLFNRNTTVTLLPWDVGRYIETFILTRGIRPKDAIGHIEIMTEFVQHEYMHKLLGVNTSLDIHPLIDLHQVAQNFTAVFRKGVRGSYSLNWLISRDGPLKDYSQHGVTGIGVRLLRNGHPKVNFRVERLRQEDFVALEIWLQSGDVHGWTFPWSCSNCLIGDRH